jgi:DNA-binding MarR family transcriptional regulator
MAQPNQTQLEALRAVLRARTTLTDRLETALRADELPPLGWYDVLCALDAAGGQGMRPRDLGFEIGLTPSGVTRLLDRMTDAGLIERKACPTDRRGFGVSLTEAGRKTHAMMQPVYLREVEAAFSSLVSTEEARELSEVLDRVSHSACRAIGEEPPVAAAEPTPAAA